MSQTLGLNDAPGADRPLLASFAASGGAALASMPLLPNSNSRLRQVRTREWNTSGSLKHSHGRNGDRESQRHLSHSKSRCDSRRFHRTNIHLYQNMNGLAVTVILKGRRMKRFPGFHENGNQKLNNPPLLRKWCTFQVCQQSQRQHRLHQVNRSQNDVGNDERQCR